VLLFTIYLILDETPVYIPKNNAAWRIDVPAPRGVMQQAPELGGKTVSLFVSPSGEIGELHSSATNGSKAGLRTQMDLRAQRVS